mmetsp:Transcript_36656/g.47341  ORF Transcript_36656/g.47341 Transcript_36656/m.47341 type:complete len:177 (+) Transcript_36656:1140-1670(+)
MLMVSLENGLGAIGGLCLGNIEVVDHQRLSGAGYCFSAAAPPFVSSVALSSLDVLQKEPQLLTSLEKNSKHIHTALKEGNEFLKVLSDEKSPILMAALSDSVVNKVAKWVENKEDKQIAVLKDIVAKCFDDGVYIAVAEDTQTLRVVVRSTLKDTQIEKLVATLKEACLQVVGNQN